jgi:hypothetical protein
MDIRKSLNSSFSELNGFVLNLEITKAIKLKGFGAQEF